MELEPVYRVRVIVPGAQAQALLDGVRAEVTLAQGAYADWAFVSAVGEEQFRPLPGAVPARGQVGALERVASVCVEFCLARDAQLLQRLVAVICAHHPWQVPAIGIDESLRPPT